MHRFPRIAGAAADLHGRLMRSLSHRAGVRLFRLFVRALESRIAPAAPAGLEPRLLSEPEVVALCANAELGLREDGARSAFGRGDLCVGAFQDAAIAGYCWMAFAPLPHLDGVWVEFDRSLVWTYKSFVRPAWRGKGIAPWLYRFGDAAARERGRSASLICVESHNRPSISAALHAGYRAEGWSALLLRGRRLASWRSPAAARRGVGFALPPGR